MTSPTGTDLGSLDQLSAYIQKITEALAATGTQREVIEIVLTPAVQALGATAGIVLLVDHTDQQMKIAGTQGYEDGAPTLWQEGPVEHNMLVVDILRMKEALYFEDAGALKAAYPELESRTGGLLPVANATLPMFLQHQPLGVIVLDFTEPHHFTPEERRFLKILSAQCAVALGRAEAIRTLEARVEEQTRQLREERVAQQAFIAFTEAVGSETDVQALARQAIMVVQTHLEEVSVAYYELDADRKLWRGVAWSEDVTPAVEQQIRAGVPTGAPDFAQAVEEGAAVFADGWDAEGNQLSEATMYGAAAFMPILIDGTARSMFAVGKRQGLQWTEQEQAIVRTVGRSLGLALERTEQARQLTRQRDALDLKSKELQAANEELEAFTYSASHDLRTPVRHVMGFAELAQKALEKTPNEKAQQYLETVKQGALRMNALIDGMLALSRAGRHELTMERVDLNEVVTQARRDVGEEFSEHPVRWRIADLPRVQGDRAMLQQVMTNLLSNAVKYSAQREQSEVEVWCEESASEWTIFVQDNGVGFDPRYAQKLFGIFQRLHPEREFRGTGVGLATVRRIVLKHGGQVSVESQVGEGATFRFTLPKSSSPRP